MSDQTLIVRADSNSQIGSGHVMRCLALAQGWQDEGGKVLLILGEEAFSTSERWKSEGMEVRGVLADLGSSEDAVKTVKLAKENSASWIVVDGYQFDANYQRVIKDLGQKLLFVDDYGHADYYCADIVLNQNIYAYEGLYSKRESYTKLLLGCDYVLLRREFLKWREHSREIPKIAKKILVTMGGADPDNFTIRVLEVLFLLQLDDVEVIVVVGVDNLHYKALQLKVNEAPFSVRLERSVLNMPKLMAWADVAISAGGSTTWELAFMGLPSLMIITADNQKRIVEELTRRTIGLDLSKHIQLNAKDICKTVSAFLEDNILRQSMKTNGRKIVDGLGPRRVATLLAMNN